MSSTATPRQPAAVQPVASLHAAYAPYATAQDWAGYSADDHEAWRLLYARRMGTLREQGSRRFLDGAEAIGLEPDRVPDLAAVNHRLRGRTGWAAVPVTGFLPAAEFFACLAARRFPTTVTIRAKDRLDYVPEPDIFHDVFGHVPLHADPLFADFLQRFGAVAAAARDEEWVRRLARLFWFTVEFGLIHEGGRIRVYGSGLISSHGDAANALGDDCDRRPFTLDAVLAQPFEIDRFQDVLFVLDDFAQLFEAVAEVERRMRVS